MGWKKSLAVRESPRRAGRLLRRSRVLVALGLAVVLVAGPGVATAQPSTAPRFAAANSTSTPPLIYATLTWGTSWSLNQFAPTYISEFNNYAVLPLAFTQPPKFGAYVPELASSWSTTASTVTVHVRAAAKWQDGRAVTSKDVLDSLLLQGVNGNAIWTQITGVRAPSASTVVVTVKRGIAPALVLSDLLALYPVQASQYKKFLIPGLEQDLLHYYALSAQKGAAAASSSSEGKVISGLITRLEAFAPKKLVGDGPFTLTKVTSQAVLLDKSKTFWAAAKVRVPEIEVEAFGSNTDVYPTWFTHQTDFSQIQPTYQILERVRHTPEEVAASEPAYVQNAIYFNSRKYPLTLPGVRQALAYLINRATTIKLGFGGPHLNTPATPDGIANGVEQQWLSPSELRSLNPYKYSPSKAAHLLDGLGFHKERGRWLLPDGKPFTLSAIAPNGQPQNVVEIDSVAKSLTSFGIHTTASATDQASYFTDLPEGRFDLAWGYSYTAELDPLQGLETALVGYNFISSGAAKGEPGIGFGPVEKIPGLGSVNVPNTLTQEATHELGARERALVWDWARAVNKDLPFLSLGDKNATIVYSTAHYEGWPWKSHPAMARMLGYDQNQALVLAIERGLVHPVR